MLPSIKETAIGVKQTAHEVGHNIERHNRESHGVRFGRSQSELLGHLFPQFWREEINNVKTLMRVDTQASAENSGDVLKDIYISATQAGQLPVAIEVAIAKHQSEKPCFLGSKRRQGPTSRNLSKSHMCQLYAQLEQGSR